MQVPTYQDMLKIKDMGYASVSINEELSTFKYKPKVLFSNLWDIHSCIKDCRGITFNNQTEELLQLPFRKYFGYKENGNWEDVPLDAPVVLFKKYNGFMAACTPYKDDILVSTTGSTKSEFVQLARGLLRTNLDTKLLYYGVTYLFEIVHESDPHIVQEVPGVYNLGVRVHKTGNYVPTGEGIKCSLENALELQRTDRGEGYMMYKADMLDNLNPCKLKSLYYKDKKTLMRMSNSKVLDMYKNNTFKTLDNSLSMEFKVLPGLIKQKYTAQEYIDLPEQERRKFIESTVG